MTVLIKVTQDGRRLEAIGLSLRLNGKLEATELLEVQNHPRRADILRAAPDATHMAGRVALNAEESARAKHALAAAEAQFLANPAAINERFRAAALMKARDQGIE